MQKTIINQYYLFSCLFHAAGLSLISAVYTTFLLENGLSLFEVNLTNTCFFLTIFLCEIPTGAFADIFGRKFSFVVACGLMSVSMFAYGSAHTLGGFILAEVIGGIAMTFQSGAFQAWLVDSLKHYDYEEGLTAVFARNNLISRIAGGIGAIVGSYLAVMNQALPWFTGGVVLIITTGLAGVMMKEEYFERQRFSFKKGLLSMKETAVTSIRYGLTDKSVRFILITTAIQIFSVQALNMYWQPFFGNLGLSPVYFGYLFAAMIGSVALGAYILTKIDSKGREKNWLLRSQIGVSLAVLISALTPYVMPAAPHSNGLLIAGIFFLIHELLRGFWNPLVDGYIQERIPSKERATISSFCSIAPHIGGALGLLASGAIAQFFTIGSAWIVSGLALTIGALLVSKNGKASPY